MTQDNDKRITPEVAAQIVELLPSVMSLRDLRAITGLRLDTIRRVAAPFLAIMKLQGTHPKCGCGRDRFHPYGCVDSYVKGHRHNRVPGQSYASSPAVLERRQRVIALLVEGHRFVDINTTMGFKNKDARRYLRFLTPEQLEARARAIEARGPIPAKRRQTKASAAARSPASNQPIKEEAPC
ncbi:hypothetical protein M527_29355 [Sphingobium indicum IP26]|uniref:hypothetical protein n=1 Tax=Sphingobium sp. HDIP04 TaxID=428994 RepID=UPI000370965D|nr:hypothetical protein [Sphingobium sp. HDIP04]EPR14218.1 hypothetical protein M527_29355 [Sphingobium indicum IP26]EQB03701.1 hypothetical protein L286_11820 [Sphingobium sp. HDIP04]